MNLQIVTEMETHCWDWGLLESSLSEFTNSDRNGDTLLENAEDNRKKVFKGVGVKVSNVNRTKAVISKPRQKQDHSRGRKLC